MTLNCDLIFLFLILIAGYLWGVYNFELMELKEFGICIRESEFDVFHSLLSIVTGFSSPCD